MCIDAVEYLGSFDPELDSVWHGTFRKPATGGRPFNPILQARFASSNTFDLSFNSIYLACRKSKLAYQLLVTGPWVQEAKRKTAPL